MVISTVYSLDNSVDCKNKPKANAIKIDSAVARTLGLLKKIRYIKQPR